MDAVAVSFLFIVFFLLALLADLLPFVKALRNITAISQSSMETISAENLDDDAKQKKLLNNSLQLLLQSCKIIILMFVLSGALWGLLEASIFIPTLSPAYLIDFLVSLTGIAVSVISFVFYYLVKRLYVRFRV